MTTVLYAITNLTANVILSSQGSWDSLMFGVLFFIIACGVAVSFARRKNPKQPATYVSNKGLLAVCCAFNFLVGALVVQVAATAVYLALASALLVSTVMGVLVLVWGLLALSSGIASYLKKSNLSLGAAALSVIAILFGVTESFGLAEFSGVISASVSMTILPVSLFAILGVVSLAASAGAVILYIPKKLSVSLRPESFTLEVGRSQVFTARASGGKRNYVYQWYLNNQPVTGLSVSSKSDKGILESNFTFSSTEIGSCQIYVEAIDQVYSLASNKPNVTVKSKVAIVQVVPAPLVAPLISATATAIDLTQSLLLTQSKPATGGVKPYRYQWLEADSTGSLTVINGAVGNECKLNTTLSTPLGTKSYRLQVTDSLGNVVSSNVVKIKINAIPTLRVTPEAAEVDAGESILLTAYVSGGTEPYVFQWYVKGKAIAGNAKSSFTFRSADIGQNEVYVALIDNASPHVTVKSKIIAIKVVPVPLAAPIISPVPAGIDVGQSSLIAQTKEVFGGIAPYRYQWFEANKTGTYVPINGATEKQYKFVSDEKTVTGARNYRLQITDSVGAVVISNIASLKVNEAPEITLNPESITVGIGQYVTINAVASKGTGAYRYQWYANGHNVGSNTSNYIFSAPKSGLYKVYVKLSDSAEIPITKQSEICYVANCYLPKTVADLDTWRNSNDWDKVVGFDLLDFAENCQSEDDFKFQLDLLRDYREDWCSAKGWSRQYANAAITSAYHSLKSGRRNILYAKRLAALILDEWKLSKAADETLRADCITTLMREIEKDTDYAWENPNIQNMRKKIQNKMLELSGFDIGKHLADIDVGRYKESLFFLEDAVQRIPRSDERFAFANNWLGVTLCNLNRQREALSYLRTALKLRGGANDYRLLIDALLELEDWHEAKQVLEEYGDKLKFSTSEDCLRYAITLGHLREFRSASFIADKAVEFAREDVARDPNQKNKKMLETCDRWARQLRQAANQNPYGY